MNLQNEIEALATRITVAFSHAEDANDYIGHDHGFLYVMPSGHDLLEKELKAFTEKIEAATKADWELLEKWIDKKREAREAPPGSQGQGEATKIPS